MGISLRRPVQVQTPPARRSHRASPRRTDEFASACWSTPSGLDTAEGDMGEGEDQPDAARGDDAAYAVVLRVDVGTPRPGLETLDRLARLQLAARRQGCHITLQAPST